MRDGWRVAPLGDLCELTKGTSATRKTPPGPYPLIVTGAEPSSSDSYQFDGEAVCVPLVSSTGHGHASLKRVHFASGRFAVANIVAACIRQPDAAVSMRWLWLYLHHRRDDLIVTRMKGTANVSLSLTALAGVPVDLPALSEQHRVVDLVGALDGAIDAAQSVADSAGAGLGALRDHLCRGGQAVRVGDVLKPLNVPVEVDPAETYAQIGLRSHGRGSFDKDPVTGSDLGKKKVVRMHPGALCFNIVFAWEGAVTVLGPDVEGKIASHRFPNYVSTADAGERFMAFFFRTQIGQDLLQDCSPGGAGRNRTLNRRRLMDAVVEVPVFSDWPGIVQLLDAAQMRLRAAEAHVRTLADLRANLLTALLSGEHEIPDTYEELMAG